MTELISIAEAMEILGVSKPTIYKLIHAGELHPFKKKVDRRTFFNRAEVDALRTATTPKLDAGLGTAGLTERPKPKPQAQRKSKGK